MRVWWAGQEQHFDCQVVEVMTTLDDADQLVPMLVPGSRGKEIYRVSAGLDSLVRSEPPPTNRLLITY